MQETHEIHTTKVCVIGLGYVGLPVAVSFSSRFEVVGFDINQTRVSELCNGYDRNNDCSKQDLGNSNLVFTAEPSQISESNFYIIAVPTPIDSANIPDLSLLKKATEVVGFYLKQGDCVVYESTVYPGVTEDICVPILKAVSGLEPGSEFLFGYSPERINPGDKTHTFSTIKKVVSGCNLIAVKYIANVYEEVVDAGVHKAETIKVAEASKVVENTQRDINIALMNEFSRIFSRLNIDTYDVLNAAKTKWNFIDFTPGLVGGHCIGVDPYYLTYCAKHIGYTPDVILSGRKVNDAMGRYIAEQSLLMLVKIRGALSNVKVRVLGITFKADCNDVRNSKVVDMVKGFIEFGCDVVVEDPVAVADEVKCLYGIDLAKPLQLTAFAEIDQAFSSQDDLETLRSDIVVLAVPHKEYIDNVSDEINHLLSSKGVLVDVKGVLNRSKLEKEGVTVWRL